MRVLTSLTLALLLAACTGDDEQQPTPEAGLDQQVTDLASRDAQPDQAPQPDLGPPPTLTSSHTGWQQALCFTCHTTGNYPHGSSGYREPQCAECHGYNGAPHKSHATKNRPNCKGCHTATSGNHAASFNAPDDCIACHFHPGI